MAHAVLFRTMRQPKAWARLILSIAMVLPGQTRAQTERVHSRPAQCTADTARYDVEGTWNLAVRYAPILEFAPEENYFPTVPFVAAFDLAGRGDTVAALGMHAGDADRIAPVVDQWQAISWDSLNAAYAQRVEPRRIRGPQIEAPSDTVRIARSAAVFFRSRCLSFAQADEVWRFLRNDPQAWRRLKIDSLYREGLRQAAFQVLEYYFYYVRDAGLEGHPHDIEKVFVFLPVIPLPADTAGHSPPHGLLRSLTIIVGAAHSSTTPNNVLVITDAASDSLHHPAILVERGGHSSAPDRNDDGSFTPGLDINVNLSENVWGVRDVQAISGQGYLGTYSSWMTLPRDPSSSVTLRLNTYDVQVRNDSTLLDKPFIAIAYSYSAAVAQRYGRVQARQRQVTGEDSSSSRGAGRPMDAGSASGGSDSSGRAGSTRSSASPDRSAQDKYILLPVGAFDTLYANARPIAVTPWEYEPAAPPAGLRKYSVLQEPTRVVQFANPDRELSGQRETLISLSKNVLKPLLSPWKFTGVPEAYNLDSTQAARAVQLVLKRMAYWNRDMIRYNRRDRFVQTLPYGGTREWGSTLDTIKPIKWHIWENTDYIQDPPDVLKAHLFRPSAEALPRFGLKALMGTGYNMYFGTGGQEWQVALVVPGNPFMLSIPGVLEVQATFYRRRLFGDSPDGSRIGIGLLYQRHYKSTLSWYLKAAMITTRAKLEGDPNASDVVLGIGGSLMPLFPISDKLPHWLKGVGEDIRLRAGFRLDAKHLQPRLSRFELGAMVYSR
jgi:hypothetical protein